jgi:hypothetical protein
LGRQNGAQKPADLQKQRWSTHFQNTGESAGRPFGWTVLDSNQYFFTRSLCFLESGLTAKDKFISNKKGLGRAGELNPNPIRPSVNEIVRMNDWLLQVHVLGCRTPD